MKSINDLTERQRRYLMWRLVQEAVDHMNTRDARRRTQSAQRRAETKDRLEPLEVEISGIGVNPFR
mgnify:FL=1